MNLFAQWIFLTGFILFVLYMIVRTFFYKSVARKEEKNSAYLRAFFVYGFFGVVYQWIRYDFDETPEQIVRHTAEAVLHAAQERAGQQAGAGKNAGEENVG